MSLVIKLILGRECEKGGSVFRPMRLWGSARDTEFLQERLEDVMVSETNADDDTSDLHPWKKGSISITLRYPILYYLIT